MEEKPFRVLLDMTEINVGETELKYVWMYVSPRELKTIFDFKSAIINKFPFIQENFKLFVRDGLVPESEKIAILREDDSVKLQYEYSSQSFADYSRRSVVQVAGNLSNGEQRHCDSGSSKESRKRKTNEFVDSLIGSPSSKQHKKKKKRDKSPNKSCLENLNGFEREETALNNPLDISNAPSKLPEENCSKQISHSSQNTESTVSSTDENHAKDLYFSKNSKSKMFTRDSIEHSQNNSGICKISNNSRQTNSSTKNITNTSASSNLDISLEIPSEMNLDGEVPQEGHSKKRKRRRKRKRKESANTTESCLLGDVPACEMEISFHSDVASKAHDNSSDVRKHIIYHSPTPPKITDTVILDSNISNPQIPQPSVVEVEENFAEVSELDACVAKFMQEDTYVKSAKSNCDFVLSEVGVSPRVSTPFSKRKFKGQSWGITPLQKIGNTAANTFTVENSNTSKNEKAAKLPYVDCTPLNYLPPVGTRLAYKTLELNENYCPEVTEYKEGILKKIDPGTDELEIELIQEEVKPGRTGKFENLREDEVPPPQVIKTVHLNWTALIEPRIIS